MKTIYKSLLTLCVALVFGAIPAFAQISTPYSMYGYGILGDRATSMQRQMGSVGYAMQSGRQINVMNPASYAAIDSLTFLFDIGADVSFLWSKEGDKKDNSIGGGLDYVTMQFPLSKFMGMSLGLVPYSNVGYAFGSEIKHGAMQNQGSGGITEAYLGLSGKIKGFSLGFNVSYDFGNIINDVYSTPENSGQTLFQHVMQVRDWNVVVGAQYNARLNKNDRLTVGATWSPKKGLHGNTWATVQETVYDSKPDTLGRSRLFGHYEQPTTVGGGVSFLHEHASRLFIEADVTWQQWSKTPIPALMSNTRPDVVVFQGMNFRDRLRVAAGAEFIPQLRGNYGERMAYRLGVSWCNDYLDIEGNRVREIGVSCGVGLQTPGEKTMINIGLEWKNRRAWPNALISENYLNVTLGVNFNDVWFWKRKIR